MIQMRCRVSITPTSTKKPTKPGCCNKNITAPVQCPYFPQCPCPGDPSCPGHVPTTPAPGPSPSCTEANQDSYASGVHMACCQGLVEQLKNWDGAAQMSYRCVAADSQCWGQDLCNDFVAGDCECSVEPQGKWAQWICSERNGFPVNTVWCSIPGCHCNGQSTELELASWNCPADYLPVHDESGEEVCASDVQTPVDETQNDQSRSTHRCHASKTPCTDDSSVWHCSDVGPLCILSGHKFCDLSCTSFILNTHVCQCACTGEDLKACIAECPADKVADCIQVCEYPCTGGCPGGTVQSCIAQCPSDQSSLQPCVNDCVTYCPGGSTTQTTTTTTATTTNAAGPVEIRNPHSGRCLDLDSNGNFQDGTKLQLWDCSGWDGQMFEFRSGEIINSHSGKCLDLDSNGNLQDGTKVQLWDCVGWHRQQWEMVGGEVRNIVSGKCLDINSGGNFKDGTNVEVWTCTGWDGQLFEKSQASAVESINSAGFVV